MTSTRPFALVLGAAVRPGNIASPALQRRIDTAAALYQAGQVGGIVASGAAIIPGLASEAQVIAQSLIAAGVPDHAIWQETDARTTEDNLRLSAPILRAHSGGAVLLVTDFWHMPRAVLVARRQGLHARAAPVPWRTARPVSVLRGVLRELVAYVVYWVRGKGR